MQAYPEGSCLRYPELIPPQREITYEAALVMLLKAAATAQTVPFTWGYVDKPADGTVVLLYLPPNSPYPNDGIRWQDNEIKAIIPAGHRELEVCELKFGFVPTAETTASRLRRRYRLLKGGNPQLVLIHYTRSQGMMVSPALANQPVRVYPLRVINEPGVYVAGEKQGQKVFPGGGGGGGMPQGMGMGIGGGAGPSGMGMGGVGIHPSAATGIPGSAQGGPGPGGGGGMPGPAGIGGPPTMVPSVGGTVGSALTGGMSVGGGVSGVPGAGGGSGMPGAGPNMGGVGGPTPSPSAMGLPGMNLSNMSIHQQQALIAQQNNHMEALERRRERERAAAVATAAAGAQQGPRPHHRLPDEDDSGDEIDQISTRTIALARYKRNHDWMNQVFCHAAFGKTTFSNDTENTTKNKNKNDATSNGTNGGGGGDQSKSKSSVTPYSIFTKAELEAKITNLSTEIESLERTSAERKAEKIRAVQTQYHQHQHQDPTTTTTATTTTTSSMMVVSAVGAGDGIVV